MLEQSPSLGGNSTAGKNAAHPAGLRFPAPIPAANQAVMGCLQATEAAAVALRLAELQLEQWGSGEASAGAALSSPTEATATAAGAAAALEHLHSDGPASETPTAAAPTAAAAVPKRKRGGNVVAPPPPPPAASDAAAAAAAAASGRLQGPGKGLRHFSLKVCEKVEEKGDTSYEEVANELIADLAAEVAAGALLDLCSLCGLKGLELLGFCGSWIDLAAAAAAPDAGTAWCCLGPLGRCGPLLASFQTQLPPAATGCCALQAWWSRHTMRRTSGGGCVLLAGQRFGFACPAWGERCSKAKPRSGLLLFHAPAPLLAAP